MRRLRTGAREILTKMISALAFVALAAMPTTAAAVTADAIMGSQNASFQARLDLSLQYLSIAERVRDASPPQWLPGGESFVFWSSRGKDADTWTIVHAPTGRQEPVLSATELEGLLSNLLGKKTRVPRSMAFLLDPKGRIIFRVEGRDFALDPATRAMVSLPEGDVAAAHLAGSLPSPEGDFVAAQSSDGISVKGGDGVTRNVFETKNDLVWELYPTAWSPNGRYLMVARDDQRLVHKIPVVDYAPRQENVAYIPYAKVGTPLPQRTFQIFNTSSGKVADVRTPPGEAYYWIAGWRPDASEALIIRLSRDAKRLDLYGVDPGSGASRHILKEERPETFIGGLEYAITGWAAQLKPLRNNRQFLWLSERGGRRHLYLYDYDGKLKRRVTGGKYVVHEAIGTSADDSDVFLVASADGPNPYDRLLFKAPINGGPMKLLSSSQGDHQVTLSPTGRYYADTYSSLHEPPVSLVGSTHGRFSKVYHRADVSKLAEIGYSPPERVRVLAADGVTDLHGALYKPWDFDPSKKYPVINYVYGGPWLSVTPIGFAGRSSTAATKMAVNSHAMAQMGFVVVLVDNRGTPGRHKAFQDANYGRVGQIEILDQVAAVRQVAASRPYMDLDRVGIYGHSWGGYFALRGMLTAPDFYKAGYAGAPGGLGESALINEPNLGLPTMNAAGYEAGSNLKLGANLKGPLKIMHGTADKSAPLATSMRMADALIEAGKQFELLIMPGQAHNPEPELAPYYFEDQVRFFERHLGGPR